MSDRKAVRFEITYDDGCVALITGDEADRHLRWLDGACGMAWVHGYLAPDPLPVWDKVPVPEEPVGRGGDA